VPPLSIEAPSLRAKTKGHQKSWERFEALERALTRNQTSAGEPGSTDRRLPAPTWDPAATVPTLTQALDRTSC